MSKLNGLPDLTLRGVIKNLVEDIAESIADKTYELICQKREWPQVLKQHELSEYLGVSVTSLKAMWRKESPPIPRMIVMVGTEYRHPRAQYDEFLAGRLTAEEIAERHCTDGLP